MRCSGDCFSGYIQHMCRAKRPGLDRRTANIEWLQTYPPYPRVTAVPWHAWSCAGPHQTWRCGGVVQIMLIRGLSGLLPCAYTQPKMNGL